MSVVAPTTVHSQLSGATSASTTWLFTHIRLAEDAFSGDELTPAAADRLERQLVDAVNPVREASGLDSEAGLAGVVAFVEDDRLASVIRHAGDVPSAELAEIHRRAKSVQSVARSLPDCQLIDTAQLVALFDRLSRAFRSERRPLPLRRWLAGNRDRGGYDSPKAIAALACPGACLLRRDSDVTISPGTLSRLARTSWTDGERQIVSGQYASAEFIDRVGAGRVDRDDVPALLNAFPVRVGACAPTAALKPADRSTPGSCPTVDLNAATIAEFLNILDRDLNIPLMGPISGAGMVVPAEMWTLRPPLSNLRDFAVFCDDRIFCRARPSAPVTILRDAVCEQNRHPQGFTTADAAWHLSGYLPRLTSGIVAAALVPHVMNEPGATHADLHRVGRSALERWVHALSSPAFHGTLLAAFVDGDAVLQSAGRMPGIAPLGLRAAVARLAGECCNAEGSGLGAFVARLVEDVLDWAPGGAWSRDWALMLESARSYPVVA